MKLDISEFDLDGTKNTVIFDLDGTLADIEEMLPRLKSALQKLR